MPTYPQYGGVPPRFAFPRVGDRAISPVAPRPNGFKEKAFVNIPDEGVYFSKEEVYKKFFPNAYERMQEEEKHGR